MASILSDKNIVKIALQEAAKEGQIGSVILAFSSLKCNPSERRTVVDQSFREHQMNIMVKGQSVEESKSLVLLSVDAAQKELCSTTLPFVLLSDTFDMLPLSLCIRLFDFVECHVTVWKKSLFYNTGKNLLLRMCNDLLRRTSKTQDTAFCGHIQTFLARLFPLNERSGVNLRGIFNVENFTRYVNDADDVAGDKNNSAVTNGICGDQLSSMDISEDNEESMKVSQRSLKSKSLYQKFWALQDYFRHPAQLFESDKWTNFMKITDEILDVFQGSKLMGDSGGVQVTKCFSALDGSEAIPDARTSSDSHYFPKYLTNTNLFHLQLGDSNTRRVVLLQLLIVSQYLQAPVKFKLPSQVLVEENAEWLKSVQDKALLLMSQTPPKGELFTTAVKRLLYSEEHWNIWKNDGCEGYFSEVRMSQSEKSIPVRKRRKLLSDELQSNGNSIFMGNPTLTQLWSSSENNPNDYSASQRKLNSFFEEQVVRVAEQADPAQMVDDEYKVISNPVQSWRLLRLMSRFIPAFFRNASSDNEKRVSSFIEENAISFAEQHHLIKDVASTEETMKDESMTENGNGDESKIDDDYDEDIVSQDEPSVDDDDDVLVEHIPKGTLQTLVSQLTPHCQSFVQHLSLEECQIEEISTAEDAEGKTKLMLQYYLKMHGSQSSSLLIKLLHSAGLSEVADVTFGIIEDPVS